MAKPLKDPRLSNRWFGPGALGRFVGGEQSVIPQPRQFYQPRQLPAPRPGDFKNAPKHLDKWDQLTPAEKNVLDRLPGIADNRAIRWLTNITETKFGHALFQTLDSLAEGLERGAGTVYQIALDPQLRESLGNFDHRSARDLGAAWNASSAFYDSIAGPWNTAFGLKGRALRENLFGDITPETQAELEEYERIVDQEYEHWGRVFKGLDVDTGGLPFLVEARQRLLQGEDIETIKHDHIENLGALAIRSQLWDAVGHVALDPLNFLLPKIKPIERLTFARNVIKTSRVSAEVSEAAADVSRALNVIEETGDLGRLTDLASAAGRLDLGDVTTNVTRIQEGVAAGRGLAELTEPVEAIKATIGQLDEMRNLTRAERGVLWLTGGDPLAKPKKPWNLLGGRVKVQADRVLPWKLSPMARAQELVNTAYDNVRIILNMSDDPVEWVGSVKRAAAGAFGGKFGHMMISSQGRHFQGVLKAWGARGDDLLRVWTMTENERRTANIISRITGTDIVDVVHRLQRGGDEAKVILDTIADSAGRIAREDAAALQLADAVRSGEVGLDQMLQVGQVLKGAGKKIVPYTPDMFRGILVKEIAEDAAILAKVQYGITQKGFIQKASDAVKAAESLVLLGLNPKYPVQNVFNNNFTMIARGITGNIPKHQLEEVLSSFGPLPARAKEGFTIAGDIVAGLEKEAPPLQAARTVLNDALIGEKGWLDRVAETIQGIESPIDFRRWSGEMEKAASLRAYTIGKVKAWREVWQPGKGFTHIDDYLPGLSDDLRVVDPLLPDYVTDAVKSVRTPEDVANIKAANLRLNEERLFTEAAETFGVDAATLRGAMGEEIFEAVRNGLKGLGDSPSTQQVTELFENIAAQSERHIDDLIANGLPLKVDEYATKIAAEGPQGVLDIYDEIAQMVYGRQLSHFNRLDSAIADILRMDPGTADIAWRKLLADADRSWNHTWDFVDAGRKGIVKGWNEVDELSGAAPEGILEGFRRFRVGNQDYIKLRNKTWSDFFKDVNAGKFADDAARQARANEIFQELDIAYRDLINNTDLHLAQMDELFFQMAAGRGQDVQDAVKEWRGIVRFMKRADMSEVQAFRESTRGLPAPQLRAQWHEFSKTRLQTQAQIAKLEQYGKLIFGGDENVIRQFLDSAAQKGFAGSVLDPEAKIKGLVSLQPGTAENTDFVNRLANRYGIPTATKEGKPLPQRVLNTVNKYLRGEYTDEVVEGARQFEKFEDIPAAAVVEALEARATANGEQLFDWTDDLLRAGIKQPSLDADLFTIPDINQIVSKQIPLGIGLDELWFEKSSAILDQMRIAGVEAANNPAIRFPQLPDEVQRNLNRYLEHVTGQLNDANVASNGIAGALRDSALLNYTRTYNYDTWLSTIAPFEFWFTHSIGRWAVHSIDRPAMLGSYLKMQDFMSNVIGERNNLPSRLKGRIKINLPFAPPEMGDIWVDPFRSFGIPFEQFFQPFVRWQQATMTRERRAERKLDDLLGAGEINTQEYNNALESRAGPLWERVLGLVEDDDASSRFDMLDFMNFSASPHLPITAAWNVARGTPEDITVLPHTRTLKSLGGLLGVDPGTYDSVWGNVRKAMGLPAFDKWDDYRVDRELSNMAAEGHITANEAMQAMIDREGDFFDEALRRVDKTLGVNWFMGMLGLPIQPYPVGEERLRETYDEFYAALDARDTGDPEALTRFFDENPEFETRLALWKSPEERLQTFLVDNIWTRYNDLNALDRRIVREALGEDFQNLFLNSETKQPDQIPPNTLAVWLKMMGGETPGTMGEDALPIALAPPAISNQAQVFYDYRNRYFPNYFELQSEYFTLPENEDTAKWLEAHPELEAYWAWRDKAFPNWRELQDAYFALPELSGGQAAFLSEHPQLKKYLGWRDSAFPGWRELQNGYYDLPPGGARKAYLKQNPQLKQFWDQRRKNFPNYQELQDAFHKIPSPKDAFLNQNPELAEFWDKRKELFPEYKALTEVYGTLKEGDLRSDYLERNPRLREYWSWRNEYLSRNPDVAPFLDDDFEPNYETLQEAERAFAGQPTFTWEEWELILPPYASELVRDFLRSGEEIPEDLEPQLEKIADELGVPLEEIMFDMESAFEQAPLILR